MGDNRVGIRKSEYFAFVQKLPLRARVLFEALSGIESRFKRLDESHAIVTPRAYQSPNAMSDEADGDADDESVLLYEDMTELVEKVMSDMASAHSDEKVERALL